MSRVQLLSLGGLLVAAVVLGFGVGLRSLPPGETTLINTAAADYIAETGGAATDCYARPSALPDVRLVVICEVGGVPVWSRALDRFGRTVAVDPGVLDEEPIT